MPALYYRTVSIRSPVPSRKTDSLNTSSKARKLPGRKFESVHRFLHREGSKTGPRRRSSKLKPINHYTCQ